LELVGSPLDGCRWIPDVLSKRNTDGSGPKSIVEAQALSDDVCRKPDVGFCRRGKQNDNKTSTKFSIIHARRGFEGNDRGASPSASLRRARGGSQSATQRGATTCLCMVFQKDCWPYSLCDDCFRLFLQRKPEFHSQRTT
jgi:hypothetical protein